MILWCKSLLKNPTRKKKQKRQISRAYLGWPDFQLGCPRFCVKDKRGIVCLVFMLSIMLRFALARMSSEESFFSGFFSTYGHAMSSPFVVSDFRPNKCAG